MYPFLPNNLLSERSITQQDVESEKEVWEGVSHENFVKMADDSTTVSVPGPPYVTPRSGLSSITSANLPPTFRSCPERSKSDMRISPKTPLSSLQRSHSTPLSVEDIQEGSVRSRSRPTPDSTKPLRPLQDQLNQIEDETVMIREQTELSVLTEVDTKSEETAKLPSQVEIEEEEAEGKALEKIKEEKEEIKAVADLVDEVVDEIIAGLDNKVAGEKIVVEEPVVPKEDEEKDVEAVEEREATPREESPGEPPKEVEGEGRGTPNECSVTTFQQIISPAHGGMELHSF